MRDPKQPVIFDLPDDDSVTLVTWEFIVDKFETILSGLNQNIALINEDLSKIDKKLDDWIEE